MTPVNSDVVQSLKDQLLQWDHEYYTLSYPTVTDAEYDRVKKEYISLTGDTAVRGRADSGKKQRHKVPMLSLSNVFSEAEIHQFFSKYDLENEEWTAEYKVDGLSLSLIYEHGKLTKAITRGDGVTGDDVTANAMNFVPRIVEELAEDSYAEIRGEVIIPRSTFKKLNETLVESGEEPFANARNAASGSLKLKDASESKKRGLQFISYRFIVDDYADLLTHGDEISALKAYGFTTVDTGSIESLIANRDSIDYDTDGLVIKIKFLEDQQKAGDANGYPKWACAYKLPQPRVTTILLDIVLTVGRTGQITPNAVLKPVQLDGSRVKAASLCNQDEIDRLGIDIGDTVIIEKACAIIPKIVGRVNTAGVSEVL
jgi:DNA ligase (NAD+)